MIIAMITMRVVQPAGHEIVDVVAVRDCFMSAIWTMRMWAVDLGRTLRRICRADRDDVFVHMVAVHMVKMTVVDIVHMAIMSDCGVAAIRTVLMRMVGHWRCPRKGEFHGR
jgi:hypothetical protein